MPVLCVRIGLQAVTTDVEPYGRIERSLLLDQDMNQFVMESVAVFGGGEIALLPAPVANGFRYALDQLADAGLALRRAQRSVKIFTGHNVDGGHRPVFGRFHITLLKDCVALGIGDAGGAEFPLHFAVRRNSCAREVPRNLQPGRGILSGSWLVCRYAS